MGTRKLWSWTFCTIGGLPSNLAFQKIAENRTQNSVQWTSIVLYVLSVFQANTNLILYFLLLQSSSKYFLTVIPRRHKASLAGPLIIASCPIKPTNCSPPPLPWSAVNLRAPESCLHNQYLNLGPVPDASFAKMTVCVSMRAVQSQDQAQPVARSITPAVRSTVLYGLHVLILGLYF